MSTIVWCPLCGTVLVAHNPQGLVPWHLLNGHLCSGTGQTGLTGVAR